MAHGCDGGIGTRRTKRAETPVHKGATNRRRARRRHDRRLQRRRLHESQGEGRAFRSDRRRAREGRDTKARKERAGVLRRQGKTGMVYHGKISVGVEGRQEMELRLLDECHVFADKI